MNKLLEIIYSVWSEVLSWIAWVKLSFHNNFLRIKELIDFSYNICNDIYKWEIWKNSLFLNVLGGVLVAILIYLWTIFQNYFRKRKYKFLLGNDANKNSKFYLAYAKLALPEVYNNEDIIIKRPYIKPNKRTGRQGNFSMDFPVSSCEVRALKYLTSSLLSQFSGKSKLVADIDEGVNEVLNFSFISLGGPLSNYKTEDLLNNSANIFLKMGPDNFVTLNDESIIRTFEPEHDYGIIIKIRPTEFPNKVWIACAGLGEWGTSGSAYFLSNKYLEILKKLKSPLNFLSFGAAVDFVALIRVRKEQDESAKLIAFFKSQKGIDDFIKLQSDNIVKVQKKTQSGFPLLDIKPENTSSVYFKMPKNNYPSADTTSFNDSTSASNNSIIAKLYIKKDEDKDSEKKNDDKKKDDDKKKSKEKED